MHKYEIIIRWSDEDDAFLAEVRELPGCMAHGDSSAAALTACEEAIGLWIDTARDLGRPIPAPARRRIQSGELCSCGSGQGYWRCRHDRGWTLAPFLSPSGPTGPRARPEAALEAPWGGSRDEIDAFFQEQLTAAARLAEWMQRHVGRAETTAVKHAQNVETFLFFLSSWEAIPLESVTEYDLRLFLWDWYTLRLQDMESRTESMPRALLYLFEWLAVEEGVSCPWAADVLADRKILERWGWRTEPHPWRRGPPPEPAQVRSHAEEVWLDLDLRVLLHDPGLEEDGHWSDSAGFVEAGLERELQRRWLMWRDEVVRSGELWPRQVRKALTARQREWEGNPHPGLDGRSPVEAVREERASPTRDAPFVPAIPVAPDHPPIEELSPRIDEVPLRDDAIPRLFARAREITGRQGAGDRGALVNEFISGLTLGPDDLARGPDDLLVELERRIRTRLSERQMEAFLLYFGLTGDGRPRTYAEIGRHWDRSGQRARHIVGDALKKLAVREPAVHLRGRGLWLMKGPGPGDRPAGFERPADPRDWS